MTPGLPKTFTPHRGIMRLGEVLTRAVEKKLGVQLWDGEDGLQGVAADLLKQAGIKQAPISLTGNSSAITPRAVAEDLGIVKRKRKSRAKVK